ncbi:MAG TPA: hypothetical protein VFH45_13725, partial [Acidimicrobiales bacterium]|nr:hypothetical protein [Acidimicrobiales bacterium]
MDHTAGGAPLRFRWGRPGDVDAVVALVESAYRGEASRQGWTTEADLLAGRRTGADEVSVALGGPRSAMVLGFSGADLVCCCRL